MVTFQFTVTPGCSNWLYYTGDSSLVHSDFLLVSDQSLSPGIVLLFYHRRISSVQPTVIVIINAWFN